jgi:hypothetical protein
MGQNVLNSKRGGGEPMTLNTIIADLKKSGVNSKLKVINKLENLTREDLISLQRDIKELICKEETKK